MEMLRKAQKMLEKHPLCNHCLGRQFALLGYGLSNQKRGEALKLLLTMKGHQQALGNKKVGFPLLKTMAKNGSFDMAAELLRKMRKRIGKKRECYLCQERFENLEELIESALETLKGYEYTTFLVGVELPNDVEEREDEFKADFEVKHGESMRNDFSRDIGKKISEITKKAVEYKKPDVVVLLNPFTGQVTLQANPLYMEGRYKKMIRGIPQSKWVCRKCRGKGCPRCNQTGKMYPESVEEIIAGPTLEKTGGEGISFHAAGREDVDARMLGPGRPFIVEVKKPRLRFIDLKALVHAINKEAQGKVEVLNLRFAGKDDVRRLKKAEASEKVYVATVGFARAVSNEELESVEKALTNTFVRQQTPLRVLHRRADLVREKYIYEAKIKRLTPNRAEMRIRCQGGLYIKELITGDEGRTEPCVAKIVNSEAKALELDVLDVIVEES